MQSNANAYSQRITIVDKNVHLTEVFKRIEKQTGYLFFYDRDMIQNTPPINVNLKDATIEEALTICLKNLGFAYTIVKNTIVIQKAGTEDDKDLTSLIVSLPPIQVRGRVNDETGRPLSGASITVKGTKTGVNTNENGEFLITVTDENAVLEFSYTGYVSQEMKVGDRNSIQVNLVKSDNSLNQVVVTALGIKRQSKSLGYSTATVNVDQMTDHSTNFGNDLQGKVAGVNVSPPASGPGGSSKIRIRGQSSFGGDNSPLIIVDGLPINNTTSTGQGRSDGGDGLQSINQDDIASITVLKGAAAAALYGFRAKDGAIIIVTKAGAKSKGVGIEVNSNFQAAEPLDYTNFQYEYGQGENGKRQATVAEAMGSGTWNFGEKFDGALTPQFDGSMQPYVAHPGKIKKFYQTGTTFTNSVAVSGGSDKGSFRLSFANTAANAIVPNSTYGKRILNFALNYNLTDKLSIQLNANYSNEHNKNPPQFSIEEMNPNTTIYLLNNSIDVDWIKHYYKTPNGTEAQLSRFPEWSNPYWVVNERSENISRDRLFGNVTARYQFNDWLYVQGRAGQDYFTRPYDFNVPTGTNILEPPVSGYSGSFYQSEGTFKEQNLDFIIGLNKTVGKFGISVTAGGNHMKQVNTNLFTSVTNFYTYPLYTISNGQIKSPDYTYTEKVVNSLYGAAEFSYRNFLFLNVTARNDWFSTLNPKSNSYLYPSVSTSFIFTDALNFHPAWLNYGKLRAAYAEVGSDTDPYSQSLYYSLLPNPFNGNALGSSGIVSPNPNLRPLKVKEAELGLELHMFNNRVNLDASIYRKNTVDEILNVDISNASGFSQTVVNVGRLRNQGVEMLLTFVPIKGNLTWETGFNGSYNISKVLALANNQQRFDVGEGPWYGWLSQEVGQPLGSLRGYDYQRDAQGRILTSAGKFLQGDIKTFGSAIPKWVGGWNNTITFKRVQIFTQIDFKAGSKLLSNSNMNFMRTGQSQQSLVGREGGVVFPGFEADGKPNTTAVPAEEFYTTYRSTLIATPFIYDASFVRWRTLSIAYDLTKALNQKFIKGITLSANIYNVLMIKKYVDNLDPEAQGSVSDNMQGIEVHTVPTTRNYSINLNIKF
jgi:TonB-linked SusC/RagA family outer membrane protein